MLKVVIDTNLFVSSIISKKGTPAELIDAFSNMEFDLVISTEIIEEIERVCEYPKIKEKYKISKEEVKKLIDTIKDLAEFTKGMYKIRGKVTFDEEDNKFLECAMEGKVDYIVSGDKHLLSLKEFKGIKIINVNKFLKMLKEENE
jgi:hypothetical protein